MSSVHKSALTLSPQLLQRRTRGLMDGYELIVCDMAGTTVEEGGMVYETLLEVMVADGLKVSEAEMHPWHGAKKEAVLEHFCLREDTPEHEVEARVQRIADQFTDAIKTKYSAEDSGVTVINEQLPGYLRELRAAGMAVALDTGYPPDIQQMLMKKLGFDVGAKDPMIDGHISAYQVRAGRPYPYMIHQLMERLGISDVRKVVKARRSRTIMHQMHTSADNGLRGQRCSATPRRRLATQCATSRRGGTPAAAWWWACSAARTGLTSCSLPARRAQIITLPSVIRHQTQLFFVLTGADVIANAVTDLPVPAPRRQAGGYKLPDMS